MQCILRRSNPVTMAVRALSLVLLFTFVTVIFGLPTSKSDDQSGSGGSILGIGGSNMPNIINTTYEEHTLSLKLQPPLPDRVNQNDDISIESIPNETFQNRNRRNVNVETTPDILKPAVNTHEEHTLSTELQPPPVPPLEEKEHHAIVYIINLYAVKNGSSNVSEEMFQNEVVETIPDILEPLVSVLLVVEDDENEELVKHTPVDLDEFAQGLEGEGFKVDKIDLDNKAKVLKMKLEKAEAQSMIDSALKEKRYRQKRTICFKCGGGGWGGHRRHHGGYGGGGCGYRCGGGGGGYGGGGGGGWSQSSAHASSSSGGYGWGK